MVVPVETGSAFDNENPQELLDWPYYVVGIGRNYDVSPDGQRFLSISVLPIDDDDAEATVPKVNIVLNWFEELKERVPVE